MSETPSALDARHELPVPYNDIAPDDVFIPINGGYQLSNLTGKMLTVIDALGLPDVQANSVKAMVRQFVSQWYSEAKHNAETSYRGCVAPIVTLRHTHNGTERKYVWLAEGDHAVTVS